ncbi:MAG: hypothetical protein ABII82_20825, partial [Verrucomicrobiota bacterium]
MKALPLLLATSLAANAAWFAGALLRDTPVDANPVTARPASAGHAGHHSATTASPADQTLAAALNSDDPVQLRDALRAAGVDDELVRQLVGHRIWKKYQSRLAALQQNQTKPDPAIWWKNPEHLRHQRQHQTREQREASRDLHKAIQAETESLLGKHPAQPPDNPWLQRQYGFLPPERRELLQRTEQDYNELIGEVNNETMGFQLPSDQEQLRFLHEEKRRDIEALLSPEELRAYDLRNSQTAQQLRWKMTLMDATEQEYLQIFDLQKDFDAVYNPPNSFGGPQPDRPPDYWKQRQAAEQELNARIRATIGDERYADYILGNDHGYQQLQAATRRLGLPEETPRHVYALRTDIPAAAAALADDTTLDDTQTRARLADRAATAREQ